MLEWNNETQFHMFDKIIQTIDIQLEKDQVFIILDMYSEVKERVETRSEAIVRFQKEQAALIIEKQDEERKSTQEKLVQEELFS
jgi:hypothetical protein